ncbi:MAG: hypothetical protein HYX84_04830 [Chloroflexi bacterium]|nr:hypothetical protein [Chloroflexota bacterium]
MSPSKITIPLSTLSFSTAMVTETIIYIAMALKHAYPFVTANPRHQERRLNCEVIPVDKWRT